MRVYIYIYIIYALLYRLEKALEPAAFDEGAQRTDHRQQDLRAHAHTGLWQQAVQQRIVVENVLALHPGQEAPDWLRFALSSFMPFTL